MNPKHSHEFIVGKRKKIFLLGLLGSIPKIVFAGGGSFWSSVLISIAIVAVAFYNPMAFVAVEGGTVTYAGGSLVAVGGEVGGLATLAGFGPVVNSIGAGILVNQTASNIVLCATGVICGGDDNFGSGSGSSGGGSVGASSPKSKQSASIASGTYRLKSPSCSTNGCECYGPTNSCGKAYQGTIETQFQRDNEENIILPRDEDGRPLPGCTGEEGVRTPYDPGCQSHVSKICTANGVNLATYKTPPESSCAAVPSVALSASPTVIDSGQPSTLTWSSSNGATSCKWAGGFSNLVVGSSGSASTGALTQSSTYQMTCSNSSETSAPANATITVLNPDVAISAEPTRVRINNSSTIKWGAKDVKSCAVTTSAGNTLASGNSNADYAFSTGSPASVVVATQTIYTITCQTNGAPITKSVTVNVVPLFEEF